MRALISVALLGSLVAVTVANESPWRFVTSPELVSADTSSGYADADCGIQGVTGHRSLSVSDDGRYILFDSEATDIVSSAPSGWQAYLRDRSLGATSMVSDLTSCEENEPAPSRRSSRLAGAGGIVVYNGVHYLDDPGVVAIVRKDLGTSAESCLQGIEAYEAHSEPSVSNDGTVVAFLGADSSGGPDGVIGVVRVGSAVYPLDCSSDPNSWASFGMRSVEVSGDGEWVFFATRACTGADQQVYAHPTGEPNSPGVLVSKNNSGQPSDTPGGADVLSGGYTQHDSSDNGRYVVFASNGGNLTGVSFSGSQIFLHDRDVDADGIFDEGGQFSTTLISRSLCSGNSGNASSLWPTISGDGRFVAFSTQATNLDAGVVSGYNVYVYDRDVDGDQVFDEAGAVDMVLVTPNDDPNCLGPQVPFISGDGTVLAYTLECGSTPAQVFVVELSEPSACEGDVDDDGDTDLDDVLLVLAQYDEVECGDADYDRRVDLDGDGAIDIDDLLLVMGDDGCPE